MHKKFVFVCACARVVPRFGHFVGRNGLLEFLGFWVCAVYVRGVVCTTGVVWKFKLFFVLSFRHDGFAAAKAQQGQTRRASRES